MRVPPFQRYFVAKGDIDALDIHRLALAVNLYSHRKEELQPTVPDVVWAQDKPFYSKWTSEDEVLSIISMKQLSGNGKHCKRWCPS